MFYVSNSLHISECSNEGSCAIIPNQCMLKCATARRILQCVQKAEIWIGNVKNEYVERFLMFSGVS